MDTIKINKKNVKMIALRGLSGIEAENTASAFVAAGNRSYYDIETDIHRTDDPERAEELISMGIDFLTTNILE